MGNGATGSSACCTCVITTCLLCITSPASFYLSGHMLVVSTVWGVQLCVRQSKAFVMWPLLSGRPLVPSWFCLFILSSRLTVKQTRAPGTCHYWSKLCVCVTCVSLDTLTAPTWPINAAQSADHISQNSSCIEMLTHHGAAASGSVSDCHWKVARKRLLWYVPLTGGWKLTNRRWHVAHLFLTAAFKQGSLCLCQWWILVNIIAN